MKSRKLVALITSAAVVTSVMIPSVSSFADTVQTNHTQTKVVSTSNKEVTTQSKEATTSAKEVSTTAKEGNTVSKTNTSNKETDAAKTSVTQKTKEQKQQELNAVMTSVQQNDGTVQQININTGKVVQTTKAQKEQAIQTFKKEEGAKVAENSNQSFAVTFHGYSHATCYNGDNIHQLKDQNTFASSTNEALYNEMLSPNNRWNAENEAITLHDGNGADDCAFFVSSALRAIGVGIPDSTANCWTLQDNLSNMGWAQHYDLGNMQPGDVAFAGQDGDAHTYVFMGWANNAHTVAWVADSQYGWFGTNMHTRGLDSGLDISPTAFYFTAPGSQVTTSANTSANANPGYAPYNVGTVNASVLNVRSQPNTNCSVIGTLYSGDLVQILAQNGNWDTINYNGQTAYVYAPLVNGNGPVHPNNITITNPAPPQYQSQQYSAIGSGTINQYTDVMSSSTWYSNCISTLGNGTNVTITGYSNGWFRINYQEGSVWVPASRVNTNLRGQQYNEVATGVANFNSGTDVQSEATWDCNTLGYVPSGTNLTITGESNGWYRVNYADTSGWIPVNRVDNPSSYTITPMNKTGVIEFSCGYTDAKQIPSWYGYNTYTINNGTKVQVTGECQGWYQVSVNGQTEWVPTARVQFAPTAKVLGTGTVSFPSIGYTDVTSQATWYSSVTGTVNDGTQVKIIGQSGNWYNIIMPNGFSTAWIPQSRLVTSLNTNIMGTGQVATYTDIMSSNTWYSNCLGTINANTPVNIVNEVNGWYEVEYNGTTGWIPAVRIVSNFDGNKTSQASGIVEFNDLSYTDIMTGPTWDSQLAGTINNGTGVQIVGSQNGWYEINYDNTTAWIPQSRVNEGTVKAVSFNLGFSDVTSQPTWDSQVLAGLQNGTPVLVTSSSNGWSQITYGNNQTGYIVSSRLINW